MAIQRQRRRSPATPPERQLEQRQQQCATHHANMGTCYDWRLQDGCGFGKARVSDDGVNWRAP
jgi:hypothetical protein